MKETKTKTCSICGVEKPLSEYSKHRRTRDGLNYACKDCCRQKTIEYRERLRKKIEDKEEAKAKAMQVPGFVSLETPMILEPRGASVPELREYTSEQLMQELYARGFDGIVLFPEFMRGVMLRAIG